MKWDTVSTLLPSCDGVISKLQEEHKLSSASTYDSYDIMKRDDTLLFTCKLQKQSIGEIAFILKILGTTCIPLIYSSVGENRDHSYSEQNYLVFGVPSELALSTPAKAILSKRGYCSLQETDASVRDKISTALLPKIQDYLDISTIYSKIERTHMHVAQMIRMNAQITHDQWVRSCDFLELLKQLDTVESAITVTDKGEAIEREVQLMKTKLQAKEKEAQKRHQKFTDGSEEQSLESIAALLIEIEKMESDIAKRESFKQKNWSAWESQSFNKREAYRNFKRFLMVAAQSVQKELQRLNLQSVDIGRLGVALQRRLFSLNLIVQKITENNLQKLSEIVRQTKSKKFEEEALQKEVLKLEGEKATLQKQCEETKLQICELGSLEQVQSKKDELQGQIEEKAHELQALINEQNDLIKAGMMKKAANPMTLTTYWKVNSKSGTPYSEYSSR